LKPASIIILGAVDHGAKGTRIHRLETCLLLFCSALFKVHLQDRIMAYKQMKIQELEA
jgi:hypothetical protein